MQRISFCSLFLRFLPALMLLMAWLSLAGCVTRTVDSRGQVVTRTDIPTPSDEPEKHRRARIRLELASNYFEAGQTAVALDEVKQALATDPDYADAHNLRGLITCNSTTMHRPKTVFGALWPCGHRTLPSCTTRLGCCASKGAMPKQMRSLKGHWPIRPTAHAAKH